MVARDIAAKVLVRVLDDWRLPEQPMALIYHRDRYRPKRLEAFIAFARATFGSQNDPVKGTAL
ncbi:LysR substrate-binding domain-containing protein [Donghicola tyrosinivorans]|uniref:LysR substrate-binding domain-containing protein n=1 Tax=Donghicola tyrosinivorans TaxID=1652492 RepID=UPI0024819F59|nr:LysR substrate-binding domain-containing protein [Donghicola tyrosinivorans]